LRRVSSERGVKANGEVENGWRKGRGVKKRLKEK
jgi:hypothetical protein